jgi:hypothetical protein
MAFFDRCAGHRSKTSPFGMSFSGLRRFSSTAQQRHGDRQPTAHHYAGCPSRRAEAAPAAQFRPRCHHRCVRRVIRELHRLD